MVVTIAIQSPEAAAVLEAAADGRLLLVPKIDGVFANTGVIATVVDRSSLKERVPTVTVRAESRARVGSGVVGSAPVLWVEAEELVDPEPTTGDRGARSRLSRRRHRRCSKRSVAGSSPAPCAS